MIYEYRKIGREEAVKKIQQANEILKDSVYQINEYGMYVKNSIILSNFFINIVRTRPVYMSDGSIFEYLYELELILYKYSSLIAVNLRSIEINNYKWINEIINKVMITIDNKHYKGIISEIVNNAQVDEEFFYTKNIGLHKVDGKSFFATSNLIINENGTNNESHALTEDFNFYTSGISKKEAIKKFLDYTLRNIEVLLPLHCMSVLALVRDTLSILGINSGITLWIDGAHGSGKTELATVCGNYFNRVEEYYDSAKLKRNIMIANSRHKDVADKFPMYKNAVFILDDVKKEESTRNREASHNNVDFIIRSTYLGQYNNNSIESVAIVTGEYFKNQASTISRMLYMNIAQFIEDIKNRELLSELQRDNQYLADFMEGIIRWYLKKCNQEEFIKEVSQSYELLKKELKRESIKFSVRIHQTITVFMMIIRIMEMYFQDMNIDLQEINFKQKSILVFEKWAEKTEMLVNGYEGVIREVFYKVLIKPRKYKRFNHIYDYDQDLDKIDRVVRLSLTPKYSGLFIECKKIYKHESKESYFKPDKQFIIRSDVLVNEIREELIRQSIKKGDTISSDVLSDIYIKRKLAQMQLIYVQKNTNKKNYNKSFPLPELNLENNIRYTDSLHPNLKAILNDCDRWGNDGLNKGKELDISDYFDPHIDEDFLSEFEENNEYYKIYKNYKEVVSNPVSVIKVNLGSLDEEIIKTIEKFSDSENSDKHRAMKIKLETCSDIKLKIDDIEKQISQIVKISDLEP